MVRNIAAISSITIRPSSCPQQRSARVVTNTPKKNTTTVSARASGTLHHGASSRMIAPAQAEPTVPGANGK